MGGLERKEKSMQNNELKKESNRLLSCPFCGGEFIPFEKQKGYLKRFMAHPDNDCIMSAFTIDLKDMKKVQLWNNRKPMEKIVAEIGLLDFKTHSVMRETGINSEVFETVRVDKYVRLDEVLDIIRNGGKE